MSVFLLIVRHYRTDYHRIVGVFSSEEEATTILILLEKNCRAFRETEYDLVVHKMVIGEIEEYFRHYLKQA